MSLVEEGRFGRPDIHLSVHHRSQNFDSQKIYIAGEAGEFTLHAESRLTGFPVELNGNRA